MNRQYRTRGSNHLRDHRKLTAPHIRHPQHLADIRTEFSPYLALEGTVAEELEEDQREQSPGGRAADEDAAHVVVEKHIAQALLAVPEVFHALEEP
jgi:hypothetical protein